MTAIVQKIYNKMITLSIIADRIIHFYGNFLHFGAILSGIFARP